MHGGEREQRVLDVVAGQDRDRPLRRQPAPQQRRANALHFVQHLGISELAPLIVGAALRQEHALGRLTRPALQRLAQRVVVAAERLRGTNVDGAVGRALDHGIGRAQAHRAQRRRFGLAVQAGHRITNGILASVLPI